MPLVNLFTIALKAIWLNKSRSVLTMLGVIIGVGAVIMLVAIGSGLQQLVVSQFEEFGANNVYVIPGDISGGGFSEDAFIAQANNKITYRHVQDIRKLRDHIQAVTPLSLNIATVSYKSTTHTFSVTGVDAVYFDITNTKPAIGRVFSDAESAKADATVVLGSQAATKLFGRIDPLNRKITINSKLFTVIGVAEEKGGGFGGPSLDDYLYMPFTTWSDLYDSTQVLRILAKARSEQDLEPAKNAIKEKLLDTLKEDEFTVSDQTDLLTIINQILAGLTAGLGGIAAISLVVGGIGIMNIMLVSVTERTREIGLRKAIGATPKVILLQFLIESVLLSVTGGLLGVMFAYLGTLALSTFIPAHITLPAVLLAFGVSALVGIIFGVVPARKASRLSPIEALRYE